MCPKVCPLGEESPCSINVRDLTVLIFSHTFGKCSLEKKITTFYPQICHKIYNLTYDLKGLSLAESFQVTSLINESRTNSLN